MRPEYLQALDAARWNYWFIAMYLLPAIIILIGVARSWKAGLIAVPVAVVVYWLCFVLGVDYYWEVKAALARTSAEMEDLTSDTGRLFGPIIVGPIFAVMYCAFAWIISLPVAWIYHQFAHRFASPSARLRSEWARNS